MGNTIANNLNFHCWEGSRCLSGKPPDAVFSQSSTAYLPESAIRRALQSRNDVVCIAIRGGPPAVKSEIISRTTLFVPRMSNRTSFRILKREQAQGSSPGKQCPFCVAMRVHINFKLRSNVDCIETCLLTGESLNELFWTPPTPRGAGSPAGSQGKMFLCHDILSPKANAETSILLLVNPCFENACHGVRSRSHVLLFAIVTASEVLQPSIRPYWVLKPQTTHDPVRSF
jgi:hypothetical protein